MDVAYWSKKTKVPLSLVSAVEPYMNRGLRLLDLGCGAGRVAHYFRGVFAEIWGLDRSFQLLEQTGNDVLIAHGDMCRAETWSQLPPVHVIASNCVLRKDRCDLRRLSGLMAEGLSRNGIVALRVQAEDDLGMGYDQFYSKRELVDDLREFEVDISDERYRQKFSSPDYLLEFLQRIDLPSKAVRHTVLSRHYYLVKCRLRGV